MKTILRCLCLMALLIPLIPAVVRAQNSLWIDTVSVGPQQAVHLSLMVSNADMIVALQCDIILPSQLSYVANSAHLTSRSSTQTLAATLIAPNTLRVITYSLSGAAIEGNSGAVIQFDCISSHLPGMFAIHPLKVILSNLAQQNVLTSVADGQCNLLAPALGTNADTINFGRIPLGQSVDYVLTFHNNGNVPLSLRGLSSSLSEIVALDSSSAIIEAGTSIERTIRFLPVKKGVKNGSITLRSNDPQDSIKMIHVGGVAYAVNELRIGSVLARSGYAANLKMLVNNMEPFTALQCRLLLPSVLKFVNGSSKLLSRGVDQTIAADTTGSILNVLCFSPSNTAFRGTEGEVCEMTFQVSGQGGTYPIVLESSTLADSAGTNIASASYSGSLEISSPLLSLNQSSVHVGRVSIKDTARFQITISNSGTDTLVVTSLSSNNAAYQCDFGVPAFILPTQSLPVNVSFHSISEGLQEGVITIRSNDVGGDPSHINLSATVFCPNELKATKGIGFRRKQGMIELRLENTKRIAAVQADISIPLGLTTEKDSIHLTERKRDHVSLCSEIAPGMFRFIAYSPSLLPFSGDSGVLIDVPVLDGNSPAVFGIGLSNVILSDTSGHNVATGFESDIYSVVNQLPTFTQKLPDTTIGNNKAMTFAYSGVDLDGDTLNFVLRSGPAGMTVSAAGLLTWYSNFGQSSADTIVVSLSDGISITSDTAVIRNSDVLSLGITSFQAVAHGNTVLMKWATAAESNCFGFRAERRKQGDSNRFDCAFVSSPGTSNSPREYSCTDQVSDLGIYAYRIKQLYNDGTCRFSGEVEIEIATPVDFRLEQNFPNPFNPSTTIRFSLPVRSRTRLQLSNTVGQILSEIVDEELPAGSHERTWNAGLASGLYFYRLQAISVDDPSKRFVDVKKMLLLK